MLPKIEEGLASLMWFQTTEELVGSTKVVDSPAPTLKLCQLMTVPAVAVWMVNWFPEALKVAEPWATVPPAGLAAAESAPKFHANNDKVTSEASRTGPLQALVFIANLICMRIS